MGSEMCIRDSTYHVMVLMVQMGISVQDITAELEKRHVAVSYTHLTLPTILRV